MATKKTTTKTKNAPALPSGYKAVRNRLDGFMTLEVGNSVTGVYRGSYVSEGKFGTKHVYRIQITEGTTQIGDDGEVAEVGQTIGVNEKGYTKALGDLEPGVGVFVRYDGIGTEKSAKGNFPHLFTVGIAE